MLVALSNGTKIDDMTFDFGSTGGFSGLTTTRAIQLMSHLPLTIKRLDIFNAEFGSEFMEALIKQVEQFENLEWLWICDTLVGGEKEGQEAGVRLAKVLAANTTIKSLNLWSTDLIRSDNVVQWGDALMENKTLTRLALMGVDGEIEEKLRTKIKDRTPNLTIEADGADGVDESSTVSIGITTVDKEEEPESGAANDVSNSTFNASHASNSEEPAKNATATPMEATYSQASLQGAAAHLSPSVADSDLGSESDLDTTHNGEGILNVMVLNNEGAEKHCKEVEMDQENGDIKVGELRSELVGVRESVTIAEVHAEVEGNCGDDGVDGSSIVSFGITTADKEEESELGPGNDIFNSNVNASNESNCEESAKNVTATPMETPEEKTKRLAAMVNLKNATVEEEASESAAHNDASNKNVTDSNELYSKEPANNTTTIATATPMETREEKTKRLAAMKISKIATFEEMDKGYHHTTKWTWIKDKYGNCNYSLGKETTVYVKMDQPRSCSYQKWNDITKKYESIVIGSSPSPKNAEPRVELNGITLRQLRAVMANIKRRCLIERWVNFKGVGLDPNEVNLYDADRYVIRPYTVHRRKSLVARLPSTAGSQQPRFFVSHWWGEPVYDFINCVEQLIRDFGSNKNDDDDRRGGGMTADTPIWVCAYGNNQWDLKGITIDPRDSGFTKAMKEAEGRTLTILDTKGNVFTRIWCVYELYLTLIDSKEKGLWAVYTAKKHAYIDPDYGTKQERESVGIISGGSTSDGNVAYRTTSREKHFPYNVISKALNINVENANATVNDDRVHILNSIIGKMTIEIDDTPPKEHHKYTELNESLKSIFAASQASLQGAAKDGDEEWMEMLVALSNGTKKDTMDFDFGSTGGFSGLTATRAIQLMSQ